MRLGIYQSDIITNADLAEIEQSFEQAQTQVQSNSLSVASSSYITSKNVELVSIEGHQLTDLDMILCFSDSDVLNIFRLQQTTEIPVLSIELPGDNSFFSTLTLSQLTWGFSQIFQGSFEYDPRVRMLIDHTYLALNDVLISPKAAGQRMRYDILLNKQSLFQTPDSANQILVSTPTGSTALNLNLGGSIALPGTHIFQILAVASRNRGITSQIIPDSSVIEVEIIESESLTVFNYDNQRHISINDSIVTIEKATYNALFIKFPHADASLHQQQQKLRDKQSFEDTSTLTSTAKFVLHVLRSTDTKLSTSEIISQTKITNRKTLSNALNLLLEKGFIRKHHDLTDARKFSYSYILDT